MSTVYALADDDWQVLIVMNVRLDGGHDSSSFLKSSQVAK